MDNIKCKICGTKTNTVKKLTIRKKYEAEYRLCENCGFMFIDKTLWLKEAYEEPINTADTGYVTRNIFLSKKTLMLFSIIFGSKFTYLDYAGGYGMLARLMRDYGLDFLLYDLYTPNLFAKGFEYKNQEIKAITCFECFEHFVSPIEEIEKMLKISKNVFFSTRLLPEEIPNDKWEYYGTEHGQHIAFYSLKTLKFLAEKYHLNLNSEGDWLHLLTEKKISPLTFKLSLLLSKFQLDVIMRRFLKSKTISDSNFLKK